MSVQSKDPIVTAYDGRKAQVGRAWTQHINLKLQPVPLNTP